MRLRALALTLLLTLAALPGSAAINRDDPGPGDRTPIIVKIIRHFLHLTKPLDDPYISPTRP